MKKALLIGVDPGIVDTALAWLYLNKGAREFVSRYKVWRDVTFTVKGKGTTVHSGFLAELQQVVVKAHKQGVPVYVFIEGYRNRGLDMRQDQKMTVLISAIRQAVPESVVIDNTGVKNVVTEEVLRLLGLHRNEVKTNHADIKSARRIALKGAYQDPELNTLVADLVFDRLTGEAWTLTNSPAL